MPVLRLYLLTSLILFSLSVVAAENTKADERRFRATFSLGLNATQIEGDGFAGYNRLGLGAGVGVLYRFGNPRFSLSTEIGYSMKGSQTSFRPNVIFPSRKIILHYAEVPLFFNYHERQVAVFSAGVYFGQKIFYRETGLDTGGQPIAPNPNESNVRNLDLGIAGAAMFVIKKRWGIQFRASYGVLPALRLVDPSSSSGNPLYINWHHNALSLRGFVML